MEGSTGVVVDAPSEAPSTRNGEEERKLAAEIEADGQWNTEREGPSPQRWKDFNERSLASSYFKSYESRTEFESRKKETESIRKKYKTRYPAIVEKAPFSKLVYVSNEKFLLPKDLHLPSVRSLIAKKMDCAPDHRDIVLFAGSVPLYPDESGRSSGNTSHVESLVQQYGNKDGFLYLTFCTRTEMNSLEGKLFMAGTNAKAVSQNITELSNCYRHSLIEWSPTNTVDDPLDTLEHVDVLDKALKSALRKPSELQKTREVWEKSWMELPLSSPNNDPPSEQPVTEGNPVGELIDGVRELAALPPLDELRVNVTQSDMWDRRNDVNEQLILPGDSANAEVKRESMVSRFSAQREANNRVYESLLYRSKRVRDSMAADAGPKRKVVQALEAMQRDLDSRIDACMKSQEASVSQIESLSKECEAAEIQACPEIKQNYDDFESKFKGAREAHKEAVDEVGAAIEKLKLAISKVGSFAQAMEAARGAQQEIEEKRKPLEEADVRLSEDRTRLQICKQELRQTLRNLKDLRQQKDCTEKSSALLEKFTRSREEGHSKLDCEIVERQMTVCHELYKLIDTQLHCTTRSVLDSEAKIVALQMEIAEKQMLTNDAISIGTGPNTPEDSPGLPPSSQQNTPPSPNPLSLTPNPSPGLAPTPAPGDPPPGLSLGLNLTSQDEDYYEAVETQITLQEMLSVLKQKKKEREQSADQLSMELQKTREAIQRVSERASELGLPIPEHPEEVSKRRRKRRHEREQEEFETGSRVSNAPPANFLGGNSNLVCSMMGTLVSQKDTIEKLKAALTERGADPDEIAPDLEASSSFPAIAPTEPEAMLSHRRNSFSDRMIITVMGNSRLRASSTPSTSCGQAGMASSPEDCQPSPLEISLGGNPPEIEEPARCMTPPHQVPSSSPEDQYIHRTPTLHSEKSPGSSHGLKLINPSNRSASPVSRYTSASPVTTAHLSRNRSNKMSTDSGASSDFNSFFGDEHSEFDEHQSPRGKPDDAWEVNS